jgi:drug/metabolite transporter (DMT)-like permease
VNDRIVILRLWVVSIIWGLNYVASAYLLRDFSPILLSLSRLLLTSIFLLAIFMMGEKIKHPTRKDWGILLLIGLFGTLFNQYFYFNGLQHSTAGNASLIIALAPVTTTILARIFLKETITIYKLFGALLALIGVMLIVVFGGKAFGISFGDIFLLLSMLSVSISLLYVRRLTKTMPSYDLTIITSFLGTMFMIPPFALEAVQGNMHISTNVTMWIVLVSACLFGQVLSGFWWNQGISVVGASTTAMFINITPFVAILGAHFILGDPIRSTQIIGGILILIGVGLSNSRKNVPKKTAKTLAS